MTRINMNNGAQEHGAQEHGAQEHGAQKHGAQEHSAQKRRKRNLAFVFKNHWATCGFLVLGAIAITFVIFALTPDHMNELFEHVLSNPLVPLLEFIAALLAVGLFFFVTGRPWLAVLMPAITAFAMCVVHKYKVYLRGDPFMPADIILGGEVFNIASASAITLGIGSIALLVLIVVSCAAARIFLRFQPIKTAPRLIGLIVCATLSAAGFFGVFTNDAVYAAIPVRHNAYNMVNEFNSKGFFLAFMYHTKDLDFGHLKPAGYSERQAGSILEKYAGESYAGNTDGGGAAGNTGGGGAAAGNTEGGGAAGSGRDGTFLPDVIFIMSEAFWDITKIPALSFDGADGRPGDPIPNFHSLEKQSATGELYTEVYGGGTDTTEFNVLTGHSVANFNTEISSAYKFLIRNEANSVVRAFKNAGYATAALHPGYDWFYNRANVYPWLGFERFVHIGDFDTAKDTSGNYVSDAAMTDKLLEMYDENAKGSGKPFFLYTVSIQNHGPYDAGFMYGKEPAKNYALTAADASLSEKGDYAVTNFVRGIMDADESLGRITEHFSKSERPVVLIFFGDHLPGLGYNFAAYRELGFPIGFDGDLESKVNIYKGRYLIWANGKASEKWEAYGKMKANTARMSANYLGVYVAERLKITDDPYHHLVDSVYGKLPVLHTLFYSTEKSDGEYLREGMPSIGDGVSDDALLTALEEYKIAQYYELFDKLGN